MRNKVIRYKPIAPIFSKLLKTRRESILKKAFLYSLSIHFFLIFFSLLFSYFFPDTPPPQQGYMQFQIMEDSTVVTESDRKEIQKAIKKTIRERNRDPKDSELAKLQKKNEKQAEKDSITSEEDQRFVEAFGEELYQGKSENSSAEHIVSKKASTKWKLEKNASLKKKKEFSESTLGEGVTSRIKWRRNTQRKIVHRPKVDYPLYYRQKGIQATALLLFKVDTSGNVVYVKIIESSGYSKLDVIAKKALRKTRFAPVSQSQSLYDEGEIEVRFQLKD